MKKYIIAAAFLLCVAASAHASAVVVTKPVLKSFEKSFVQVSDVKWSVVKDCYQAEFLFNGEHLTALYTAEGVLIATVKNISSLTLPQKLQKKLRKNMHSMWITALVEVTDEQGTRYLVTLESAEEAIVMESVVNKKWTAVQYQVKS